MIRKVMGEVDVKLGVKAILQRVEAAYARRPDAIKTGTPLLVAVSKTKPVEMIVDAYSTGQRHFGENYVQELVEKANHPQILEQCKEIRWHFIGHLQRNKINKIINLPGLYMVATVDSAKLADSLNSAWEKHKRDDAKQLRVFVQVNTSGEEEKNGVTPAETADLYGHILNQCPNLHLEGVMTIGKFGHDPTTGPNPDFIELMKCHQAVCDRFERTPSEVAVSMGMSDDFEQAIEMGSTIVRVGSSIFGYRPKKSEA